MDLPEERRRKLEILVHQEGAHIFTAKVLAKVLPLLALVGVLEFYAAIHEGSLIVGAQFFDVASDLVAVVAVIMTSLLAEFRDQRGRIHEAIHTEQKVAAILNVSLLAVGLLLVSARVVQGLLHPEEMDHSLIILSGPVFAVLCYGWAQKKAESLDHHDPCVVSVKAHFRGDIFVSLLVFFTAAATMLVDFPWINQLGGVIGLGVLLLVFLHLLKELRESGF